MFSGRAIHCSQRHCVIECHKSAIVFNGERQQISICELTRIEQFVPVKQRGIEQGNIIGPESMSISLRGVTQT